MLRESKQAAPRTKYELTRYLINVQPQDMHRVSIQHDLDGVFPELLERQHHERISIDVVALTVGRPADGHAGLRLGGDFLPAVRGEPHRMRKTFPAVTVPLL